MIRRADFEAVLPVPADAPKPDFQHKLGTPDATWTYRDAEGAVLFYAVRFDQPDGAKQVLPYAYGRMNGGAPDWHWKALSAPRPLYGLDHLADRPADPVLVVEGEKTANAARGWLPDYVVVTWPGGAAAIGKVDWGLLAGRDVTIWPDADDAGHKAAARIGEALQGIAARVRIVELPPDLPKGWDLADAMPNGLDIDALLAGATEVEACLFRSVNSHSHLHTPPKLGGNPDLLAELGGVLRCEGVIGERRNAKLVYLAITSRLLPTPVSLVIKGVSSSGKSHTVEAVVRLFPRHAVIVKTGMSERALVYMKEDFAHRTLIIYEATALREGREKSDGDQTAYFVRSLLSEGRLNYEVTVRDKEAGGWTTKSIVKEGPTNLILTTTSTSLHSENETRMFSLPTDDTPEQTRRILLGMAHERDADVDRSEWHDLQDWLADDAEHRVTILYARDLARAVPPVAVRLRRDFKAILSLIKAHAILHQLTRERDRDGRIVATLEDYAAVRELVLDLVSEGVGATVPASIFARRSRSWPA